MKRSELFFTLVLVPLDFLALTAATIAAFFARFHPIFTDIRPITFDLNLQNYLKVVTPIIVLFILVFATTGLYKILRYSVAKEFSRIILACSASMALVFAISFFSRVLFESRFIAIAACVLIGNLIRKKIVSYILVAWLGIGIACLSFYKDTFQPQYAYQFIPIVFLLLGGVLQSIRKLTWPLIFGLVTVITIVSWFFKNPYITTDFDIPRMNALTDTVVSLASGMPFAFTVMNSRSFTDFHVRYFFRTKNVEVVPVDDVNNKTLFIVCEAGCPKAESMSKISVMCHTDLCPLDKPEIHLSDWTYVSTTNVGTSAIYAYTR